GVILDPSGNPQYNASILLMPIVQHEMRVLVNNNNEYLTLAGPGTDPGVLESTANSREDGTFEFSAVRPGDWQIEASIAGSIESPNYAQSIRTGGATVSVGRHDEEIRISLGAPFKLTAATEWSDSRIRRTSVNLVGRGSRQNVLGGLPGPPSADGILTLNV